MNRWMKLAIGSVVGGMLLLGLTTAAMAADPTPPPKAPGTRGWQQGPMMGGPRWGGNFGPQSSHKALTDLLGMTDEQIHAEREAGKSLVQIATSKGVSEAKLIEVLLASRKSFLDAMVKAGTMTQEQADAAYKMMEQRIKEMVNRTELGPNRPAIGQGIGPGTGSGTGLGMRHPRGGMDRWGGQPGEGPGRWGGRFPKAQ